MTHAHQVTMHSKCIQSYSFLLQATPKIALSCPKT